MIGEQVAAPRPASVLGGMDFTRGRAFELEQLDGGLTNRNYKVTVADGARYVARFAGAKSGLLAIDRDAEAHNSAVAAATGVGPGVVEYDPGEQVLVVDWIEARTCTDADLDDADVLARVAYACRTLHAGPRFAGDFDMFDVQRRYLAVVTELGFRVPADYATFEPQVRLLEKVLRATAGPRVACHNDLLAANVMDDGERIWFIDYEYSGNNDPCFELGNIWSEADLTGDRLEHLVTAYFGAPSPVRTARARLFGLMSKYGWTLWASIQSAVSDVDFDFWQWGMEKYARAVAEFRSPDFTRLIDTVRASSTHQGADTWPTY